MLDQEQKLKNYELDEKLLKPISFKSCGKKERKNAHQSTYFKIKKRFKLMKKVILLIKTQWLSIFQL